MLLQRAKTNSEYDEEDVFDIQGFYIINMKDFIKLVFKDKP